MSYEPAAGALRCPYCGSEELEKTGESTVLRPAGVIPFRISGREVVQALYRYFARHWFRPSKLTREGVLELCQAVYVPCWAFSAKTLTYWTADVVVLSLSARGKWRPVFGEHRGVHENVFVSASQVLTDKEIDALGHYDVAAARDPVILEEVSELVETFTVPRKYARVLAEQKIHNREEKSCLQLYVGGLYRNFKTNITLSEVHGRPVYVPVWVLAFRYRGKVYRFLVNGQTGRVVGRVPISWWKVSFCIAVGLALWMVLTLLSNLAG